MLPLKHPKMLHLTPETQFGRQLTDYIRDPARGLLIDARDWIDSLGVQRRREDAVFRFDDPSGGPSTYRTSYVTVSGLFRDPALLSECMKRFADAAEAIFNELGQPDYLVSCTATARSLMTYLAAHLEIRGKVIKQHYMGPLSSRNSEKNRLPRSTERQKVLVVTDVVATGSVVSSQINHLEADVIAVLCVIDASPSSGRPWPQPDPRAGKPLHALAKFPLQVVPPPEDPSAAIPLNVSEVFRHFLADRRNGLLLGPEGNDAGYAVTYEPNIAYQAPEGELHRQWLTLWPLFSNPAYFADCLDHLSAIAHKLQEDEETRFSSVATFTATGRHLMEHLQPRLEAPGSPVDFLYLAPYPYQAIARRVPEDFKGKCFLIVADAIATASLVTNIASVIHRLGGEAVAVLGVVDLREERTPDDRIEYFSDKFAQVKCLCQFPIRRWDPQALDPHTRVIPVDPETMLPVADTNNAPGSGPSGDGDVRAPHVGAFDLRTTLRHLDLADLHRMGLFESNGHSFTLGLHSARLFAAVGKEIWAHVQDQFTGSYPHDVLVTTTDREDMIFAEFLHSHALAASGREIPVQLIPRHDSIAFDFPLSLGEDVAKRVSGRHLRLVVNAIETSDKLFRLVSLLARCHPSRLDVLCLTIRTGPHTADFIQRSRKLLTSADNSIDFGIRAVYDLPELSGPNLNRTLASIEHVANQFVISRKSRIFRDLMEQELRYFRATSYTAQRIEMSFRSPLEKPAVLCVRGAEVELKNIDSLAYALYLNTVRPSVDHDGLIARLAEEPDRSRRYLLLVFLLSDVTYLRITKKSDRVKHVIRKALDQNRRARLDVEEDLPRRLSAALKPDERQAELDLAFSKITEFVEQESHLRFCLALFAFLDHRKDDYSEWIRDALRGGMGDLAAWQPYPFNFQAYYSTPRSLWTVSLLLHFAHLERTLGESGDALKKEMVSYCELSLDAIKPLGAAPSPREVYIPLSQLDGNAPNAWTERLRASFDAVLTELGERQFDERHRTLEFLYNRLYHRRVHHNTLITDLREARDVLQGLRRGALGVTRLPSAPEDFGDTPAGTGSSGRRDWRKYVDRALIATASLELIAEAAAELFVFHASEKEAAARYRAAIEDTGFRKDIAEIRETFSAIRRDEEVSAEQIIVVGRVVNRLAIDMQGKSSHLRKAVRSYGVPIYAALLDEWPSAEQHVTKGGKKKIWAEHSDRLRIQRDERSRRNVLVLCNPLLLREVIWNLLTNVVKGLSGASSGVKQQRIAKIGASVEVADDHVTLTITSPLQDRFQEEQKTLMSQKLRIAAFGGSLSVEPDGASGKVRARLKLKRLHYTEE